MLGNFIVTSMLSNRLQLTTLFFPLLKFYAFPFLCLNNCWRTSSNTTFNPAFVLMAVNRYLYSWVSVTLNYSGLYYTQSNG
jgi:hypothetical protein